MDYFSSPGFSFSGFDNWVFEETRDDTADLTFWQYISFNRTRRLFKLANVSDRQVEWQKQQARAEFPCSSRYPCVCAPWGPAWNRSPHVTIPSGIPVFCQIIQDSTILSHVPILWIWQSSDENYINKNKYIYSA